MKVFKQPRFIMPISLHDARISRAIFDKKSGGINKGKIILEFEDGFYITERENQYQTSKSQVIFAGVDFDFCEIIVAKENSREEIKTDQFERILTHTTVEIIDEAFGYNRTKYTCNAITKDDWYTIFITVFHSHRTIYEWEEKES